MGTEAVTDVLLPKTSGNSFVLHGLIGNKIIHQNIIVSRFGDEYLNCLLIGLFGRFGGFT
jgi:hypothetical protein